jgi:hypothetical protein
MRDKYYDDMTLKELILKLYEYFLECKRNWMIILLFAFPFIGYQLYQRLTKPMFYPASLTFMVNDSQGSSIGGVLGQLKGLTGEDEDKLDKILELAKSRRTLGHALMQKGKVNGKEDLFANHLMVVQGIDRDLKKDPLLANFVFTNTNVDSFSLLENRLLYMLHKILIGNEKVEPLFSTANNKKTGIMVFSLNTNNEELTIALIKQIYESLSNYYIESTVRKEKESYDILASKKDSIELLLNFNDYASAQHDDRSNSLLLQIDKVPAKRYNRNNALLSSLYGEIVKNTELAEFALKTATPFISVIDEPIPPIKPRIYGTSKNIAIYGFVGLIIGIFFVCLRYLFSSVMKE